MPLEPVTASAAVALIVPYLAKMGDVAAGKLGEAAAETAGKLLGWMRAKLTGGSREALSELEASPEDGDSQAVLRVQLAKALRADPGLAEELRALIPAEALQSGTMTQTVSGAGAKASQVQGSGNTTTFY